MVQVSYPGVYVRELPSGVSTITGVPTSIAVFVGMTKSGPINTPTRVLGFLEYVRMFSDDVSLSEMTDQVRQYFQNGGQQAFIVRVAALNPATASASVQLLSAQTATGDGTPVLVLTAISPGLQGRQIRAEVDYRTASPERTFNITVFRELIDESGNATQENPEQYKDLSMDPADSRYAPTVINQTSTLVTASIPTDTPPALTPGYSASAILGADNAGLVSLINAAFAGPTSGTYLPGKIRIKVGTRSMQTALITPTSPTSGFANMAEVTAAFDSAIAELNGGTAMTVTSADGTGAHRFLKIGAIATEDVIIERATDSDVTVELGLGTAQGGIEVGAFAGRRPKPSGFVSIIDDPTTTVNLDALLTLGALQKDLSSLSLEGPEGFSITRSQIVFPVNSPSTSTMAAGESSPLPSLLNIKENLSAIATAMNSVPSKWRAELQGYRLALIPKSGTSANGPNHELVAVNSASGSAWDDISTTAPEIFVLDGATSDVPLESQRAAEALIGGSDGSSPTLKEYNDAFQAIDSNVDLFNIMVLPRTTLADALEDRAKLGIWGAASDFCAKKRAFLLVDASLGADSVATILTENLSLRIGLTKDHAALYWPRLTIPAGRGLTRDIDPSGSIAGIMGRIDATRGVWKAPAGLEADIRGIVGIGTNMSDAENGLINPEAINAVRLFPNGIISWGARTMNGFDSSGDSDFKYVPVRRFELFLEESLVRGLKFAVFEPNAEPLWAQIRLAVGAFLNNLFRQGAFAGKTPRDSYFVKVDSETTTQNDINLGIVNVLVGFAPLKPAEFVVITIQQMAGQVQV